MSNGFDSFVGEVLKVNSISTNKNLFLSSFLRNGFDSMSFLCSAGIVTFGSNISL
jgi:hypothetical protein